MKNFDPTILEESNHSARTEALKPDQYESLDVLQNSPHWKVYRDILLKAKQSYLDSILAMREPIDITKHLGIAAGINFALNQLPLLVSQYRAEVEKNLGSLDKKDKPGQEFRRG